MVKTIYLNLDDDVTKVMTKIKRGKSPEVVLVFPKKSFVFSDSINLRLLKKQIDMLGKKAFILTMDEKGQMFAQEAGFELKFLPKTARTSSFSDIRQRSVMPSVRTPEPVTEVIPVRKAKKPAINAAQHGVAVHPRISPRVVAAPAISTGVAAQPQSRSLDNVFIPPDSPATSVSKKKSYRKYIIGFVGLSLIAVLLLVLVILPSATITVFAKSQKLSRDVDIIADINAGQPDSSKLTIPAVAVNEDQKVSGPYQVNGKKEVGSKSEGRVAIYNLTGSAINLNAGTTTLTVGTKSYVFKADQSGIKALTSASNDAGASVADIIASSGGESFNLPAGTRLEITNQVFGSQPQRLYAKTVTQVVGGSSRFISVVSKEDLDAAQADLRKKVVDGINQKLASQNAKLVEGAYAVNVVAFTPDKPEGTETQSFNAELQIKIDGLAFNETVLKEMIRQRMLMSLGSNKNLQNIAQDSVIYKIKNIDAANGLMQLSLHYESGSIPAIDTGLLRNQVAGKAKSEASELVLTNPDVDRVEITVQPGWQSSLPRFNSKIQIEVKE